MKPNDKPVLNKPKVKPPKFLSHEQTPTYLQNLMEISRYVGQECGMQSYNEMAKIFNPQIKKTQITAQDALNLMSTALTYLNGVWLFHMKMIAENDDSGIELADILEAIKLGTEKLVREGVLADA